MDVQVAMVVRVEGNERGDGGASTTPTPKQPTFFKIPS